MRRVGLGGGDSGSDRGNCSGNEESAMAPCIHELGWSPGLRRGASPGT